jgi:dolichol-phosphate mannosyltransferase
VIYVDDGSRDGTLFKLRAIADRDPHVRVVALSRNFGHQYALTAGLDAATGDAVAVIDADLQDPPEVIPQMVARWRAGADVVYGVRETRQGESAFKRGTAHLFYRLMQRLGSSEIPADVGDFRLLDRSVVNAMRALPERDRFLRGLVAWVGFRQEGVSYERQPRAAGETKFPFSRMLSFALDGIFSFSTVPLRLASYFGFFVSALSMAGIVFAFYIKLFTVGVVPGWAAQWIGTLFLGGVQLMSLGIIGEYVGRIYGEVKSRPLYVVRERIGFERQA